MVLALKAYDIAKEISNVNLQSFVNVLRRSLSDSRVIKTLSYISEIRSVDWNYYNNTIAVSRFTGNCSIININKSDKSYDLPFENSTKVSWGPNGQKLAIGLTDGTINIWDTKKNINVLTLSGLKSKVEGITWSPDGQWIAANSFYDNSFLWEVKTGKRSSLDKKRVISLSWNPNGEQIAFVSPGQINIWDYSKKGNKEIRFLIKKSLSIDWSPNGRLLAVGTDDGFVYIWDVLEMQKVTVLSGHNNQVHRVKWSPDGLLLASSSWDGTIKLWDTINYMNVVTLTGHTSGIYDISWNKDGNYIVSSSKDKTIRLWNVEHGLSPEILDKVEGWVWDVSWSPDGRFIASTSDDGVVRLWDSEISKNIKNLHDQSGTQSSSVAWSPDGKRLANTVCVWDTNTWKSIHLFEHRSSVWDVCWSPNSKILASCELNLSSNSFEDCNVQFWDIETGNNILTLNGFFLSSSWNPDGRLIALGSPTGTILLWNMKEKKKESILTGHDKEAAIWCLAWNPNGKLLASAADDNTVRIWNINTNKSILVITGHTSDVKGVTWSPDGKKLATASLDKTVRIWDAETGKNLEILTGHTSGVRNIDWEPNGNRLVSAGEDGTVQLFYTKFEDVLSIARKQVTYGLTPDECKVCMEIVSSPNKDTN